ncbi:MAG: prolyl oligopeptidase family serine peptidase [Thermoanaerobaculia bacterium]
MNVMRTSLITALALFLAACRTPVAEPPPAVIAPEAPPAIETEAEDPYLWLEEIDGERALAWVRQQNERTRRELASTPAFERMYDQALSVLNSASRVPSLSWKGDYLYNLRKTEENPRGIYRRTTLAELRDGDPEWTTVLDIDALSRDEGKMWVFKSMTCLPPEDRLCLVALSPGGGDAVEIRELDAESLEFVEDGFFLAEAKSDVEWIDADTIFVGTDFGPGTLTDSGYPRIVKLWRRGTPLSDAATVFEAPVGSVGVSAYRIRTPAMDLDLIDHSTTFWTSDYWVYSDGRTRKLDVPSSAIVQGGFEDELVVTLTEPWATAGGTFPAGAVVLVDPRGADAPSLVVAPTESEVIESVDVTDHSILISTLDNVRGRFYRYTRAAEEGAMARVHLVEPGATIPRGAWHRETIAFPDNGAISVMTADDESGDALVLFQSFVTPPTLYWVPAAGGDLEALMAQEATFDGSNFDVTQQWAVSLDGTRIPYFIVAPKGMERDGSNVVHIFSYGGFRNSLTPSYSGSYEQLYGAYGKLWLERGGVFVLANIRGGGEFGPEWHSQVLKENRHKVFEDFEAVAEDLVRTGITRPERIGIEGRSNGGLLTLGTLTRRPELYGAVISGAPLADMKRYHELLAGASWMAEYGDPDIPAEWAFIREWSPYQNIRADADYPPVFVYASTRDDRVHPGHARKTVAKLQALGHEVWYFENIEGGHGGSSTNEQLAYRVALSYAHLWRTLGGAVE